MDGYLVAQKCEQVVQGAVIIMCVIHSVFSPHRYSNTSSSMGMTYLLVWYRFAVGIPVHVPPIAKLTQNQSKISINIY